MPASPFEHRRHVLRAGLGALLLPLGARAQSDVPTSWEFFEPRAREYSRIRRREAPTVAIVFGGKSVAVDATWERLDAAERDAVRAIQPTPLPAADEPAYPRVGLKPLIERLRVVRGPVGQPLRIYLEIDERGTLASVAIGGQVQKLFGHEMFGLMRDAAFKPGTCEGKPCTRVFAMDIVYLGES